MQERDGSGMKIGQLLIVIAIVLAGVIAGAAITSFLRTPTRTIVEPIRIPAAPAAGSDSVDDRNPRAGEEDREGKKGGGGAAPAPAHTPAPAGDDDDALPGDDEDDGTNDGDT
jgi:hypothetical protein